MQWGKKVCSLILCVCLVLGMSVPLSAQKAEAAAVTKTVTGNQNEILIYNYVTEEMGLNSAVACGILANVYRECRFNEKAAGACDVSYGICQWYMGNYVLLVNYCNGQGTDYRTLSAQLDFLNYDLQTRFAKLLKCLREIPNTEQGAYEAAYQFCYNYERPRNYKRASESRGELSKETFWPVFGNPDMITELEAQEHTHTYTTVVNKATLSEDGSIQKICSECNDVDSTQVIRKIAKVQLSDNSFVYNGKTRKPSVTVKDSEGKKISLSNYSVSYSSGCKNVGIYTVTVTFKENYSGKTTMTYQIVPKATSIKSVTGKKKSLYVKWTKNTTQTTGYQLQFTTKNSFQNANAATITVKSKTTAQTLKKLSAKKRYYVRIRTYKNLKYNGKKVNVYSAWSKTRNAVTKA